MIATKEQQALFNSAYAEIHMAADKVTTIADAALQKDSVRAVLNHLRAATAAWQELDNQICGNAPAKRGDA